MRANEVECQKVKQGKVKLCTWESGSCKPKDCKVFKKAVCSKLPHCEYKPKMKECAPKQAEEESNGSCEKDLKAAEKDLKAAEKDLKAAEKELKRARAQLKPDVLPPAGPDTYWTLCAAVRDDHKVYGIDCGQNSYNMAKNGMDAKWIKDGQAIINSCWCLVNV